jgi:hypothetical protein
LYRSGHCYNIAMHDLTTRLYVELAPEDSARQTIKNIVTQIRPFVKGRFIDDSKWHITIMHFGIASQVYEELRTILPDLSHEIFLKALESYIAISKSTLPRPVELALSGYELLGGRNNVLALRFAMTPEIQQAHITALANLKQFFANVGLENPEAYMRKSHNFSWALTIKPHLTIARGVIKADIDSLPRPKEVLQFACANIHGL